MIIDKEKQKKGVVQNEEVFLYKLYNISLDSSKPKTPKPIFIQEVNNLEKALKTLQLPTETILFLQPFHYKAI